MKSFAENALLVICCAVIVVAVVFSLWIIFAKDASAQEVSGAWWHVCFTEHGCLVSDGVQANLIYAPYKWGYMYQPNSPARNVYGYWGWIWVAG